MKNLNPMSEAVLKYITDAVPLDGNEKIYANELITHFTYSKNKIYAILLELKKYEYIILEDADDISFAVVLPTSAGVLYFDNKEIEQTQSQTTNINIHNSQGINVGDNNTSNININTVDFNEVYKTIDTLNEKYRAEMREMVDVIKDSIENSKPLPKGKFRTFIEDATALTPIATAIGKAIIFAMQNIKPQ